MKIRLMGAPDLVRGYAEILEGRFGAKGQEYPSRGSTDIRYYLDIDDRAIAAALEGLTDIEPVRLSETEVV